MLHCKLTKLDLNNFMTIKHLLIVEDDIEMRSMITEFLRHNGFKVSTASNEKEIYKIINIIE